VTGCKTEKEVYLQRSVTAFCSSQLMVNPYIPNITVEWLALHIFNVFGLNLSPDSESFHEFS
jgi:hypothetical protein